MNVEPQAGLIPTFLLNGEPELALAETEKLILVLQNGDTLQGAEEPLRVYYACYLILEKTKDPRSKTILYSAVQLLEAQVSKLHVDNTRKMFVENVPWRLAIHRAWDEHTNKYSGV